MTNSGLSFLPASADRICPLGVYLHIPFCKRKCGYCDFYSVQPENGMDICRYTGALIKHISDFPNLPDSSDFVPRLSADTVYFGGGTPSLLGFENICAVLSAIKKTFYLDENAEISIELNPDSTSYNLLTELKTCGFNRISLGFQSADNSELCRLGRLHNFEQAKQAFLHARKSGFSNINIDVMYGLEGQTIKSLLASLDEIICLRPEHVSCYGLKLEHNTPLGMRNDINLPGDDEQADMYMMICEKLRLAGYVHYEISNWSVPGFCSRHNMKYWRLMPYAGFGPSAHSDCFGARYSNVSDISSYNGGIFNGKGVIDYYMPVDEKERLTEYIMMGLRTLEGINPADLERLYKIDVTKIEQIEQLVNKYKRSGYMNRGSGWSFTEKGFLISNTLIVQILETLETLKIPDG